MEWSVDFTPDAERDLKSLPKAVRARVLARVVWLAANFDLIAPLPLRAEWRGYYKLRAGDYRAVYAADYGARVIRIEYIDHRSRVYKRRKPK
ncbi:MAG: type II toxin-antitoxin system RelE/ParE family toxin [bacterium]